MSSTWEMRQDLESGILCDVLIKMCVFHQLLLCASGKKLSQRPGNCAKVVPWTVFVLSAM